MYYRGTMTWGVEYNDVLLISLQNLMNSRWPCDWLLVNTLALVCVCMHLYTLYVLE